MEQFQKIETNDAPKAIGPYSQAMIAHPFIFVSGQLPINPSTGKLVDSEIRLQTMQVLNNIEAILKASGVNWQHIVKTEIFLKDLNDFAIVNEEYGKKVSASIPPARQTIQAGKLPLDALIEISCIALLP